MSAPPFPNDYQLRLVSASDAKACLVCYKPTSCVLLLANKTDFFYVCESHLKDELFSKPVHLDAYKKILGDITELETKIVAANEKAEANKPYSWNKIMTSVGWKSDKKDESKETKEKDQTYEQLLAELAELKKQLAALNEQKLLFKFKYFTLNADIYKMRINSHLQAKIRAKRQAEMQNPLFFPQAPTNQL